MEYRYVVAPRREGLIAGGRVGCCAQNVRIWSEKEEKVVAPRRDGLKNYSFASRREGLRVRRRVRCDGPILRGRVAWGPPPGKARNAA